MTDSQAEPQPIYLRDYRPPDYLIDRVDLDVQLDEAATRVTAQFALRADGQSGAPLVLAGRELKLLGLKLDGQPLADDRYRVGAEGLEILEVPDAFELEIVTEINPAANTALEGLYLSGAKLCTQCEAEGFRKITYFLDRPDVMARYTTTLTADKARFPVLLANGNLEASGELEDGRHWARWHDPHPKPAYLFALVAGPLACLEDSYTTASGRSVTLRLYTEAHNLDKCDHAMASLKRSMEWDERIYGLEYDLDLYMIVAVEDFNMGAMENKGLNIFNTKLVLARPETATDGDFSAIESVIGHEYFHNWTGNRVTCRDWFQLSLKEGLTVFRDQQFSADMGPGAVKRIGDVRFLRAAQFAEDSGPLAHPVRPDSYIEINNFYTLTVYEKGAEVVRMIHTLLGDDGFAKGMNLYVQRHDGQAVTCDDFVAAMEDANGADLGQFRRWYAQAGTPEVTARLAYDADTRIAELVLKQETPATRGQPDKVPLHIPVKLGLMDGKGNDLPLRLDGENADAAATSRVLDFTQAEQVFRFVDLPEAPVPSLLRGFSAPVKLEAGLSQSDLQFLAAHDSDAFNRWEAAHLLLTRAILDLVAARAAGRPMAVDPGLADTLGKVLSDASLAPVFRAEVLTLPGEGYLGQQLDPIDTDGVHVAREAVRRFLAEELRDGFESLYDDLTPDGPYAFETEAVGKRRLRNACLSYLGSLEDPGWIARCLAQFEDADNMTDRMAALSVLVDIDGPERTGALAGFYAQWRHEPLVVDKWFSIQAGSALPGTLDEVRRLTGHADFTLANPNKVRALIGGFCSGNPYRFHAADGAGYRFLADQVLALDPKNPSIAARLAGVMGRWRRFPDPRAALMRAELERILGAANLSRDTYEIVSKSLG